MTQASAEHVRSLAEPRRVMAIVDDDPQISRTLTMWVELLGMRASVHACGQSLLDAIHDEATPLVGAVFDLTLPGMSGFELAKALRRLEPDLPLVAITGLAEHEMARHGTLPAGIPCLSKPFDLDALDLAFAFSSH